MNQESRILAGRYEIGDLIGRGGMAEVHIGYDTRLGRSVAIKMLRPDLARDPSFQTRFRREAQAAAGLNHPTIVAVYDTGEDAVVADNGETQTVPFIVMEYVEGHTVRDILKGDVAAPIDEAVDIVIGVLTALDYSHHAGLVHRDIKPANVMLTPTGAVKVMDFGIARALADSGQTMTQAQAVVGTAQYLSPEQARGENVDARSDLYSTGCLLFELLTGRPPFMGDSPVSVAYQHVREAAPKPSQFASDVPEALDRVVLKALEKSKEDRYGSASEFLADLRAVMSGHAPAVAGGAAPGMSLQQIEDQPTEMMAAVPAASATAVMPAAGAPGAAPWEPTGTPFGGVGAHTDDFDDEEERKRKMRQWWILGGSAFGAILLIVLLFMIGRGGEDPIEPTQVEVPVLIGLTEQQARSTLGALDLEVEVEYAASDVVGADRVISSNPEEGTLVDPESTVVVVVSTGQDSDRIPDVRGLLQAEAQQRIEDRGLVVVEVIEEDDPVFEQGRATRTDPVAGEERPVGTEVTLYVSSGMVDLPDLRGMNEQEARSALNELGLTPFVEDVETDEARPGQVVEQAPSASRVPVRSEVRLGIAKEPSTVTVPNVVGQSRNGATTNLQNADLQVDVQEQSSNSVPNNSVISQSPAGGETVPPGTVVTIVVSTGPPGPPPSPEPEDDD